MYVTTNIGDRQLPVGLAPNCMDLANGNSRSNQAVHASKLRLQLAALDQAVRPDDLSAPSWELHRLKGDLKGHWALTVNGNWRLVFAFEGEDAVLVDYLDYH